MENKKLNKGLKGGKIFNISKKETSEEFVDDIIESFEDKKEIDKNSNVIDFQRYKKEKSQS